MDHDTFETFLRALRDEAGARLGGSFALHNEDARPGFVSDIDLVILHPREDPWTNETVQPTPMQRAIRVFERFDVPWESAVIGAISSPRDLDTLPRPVEVMDTGWIEHEPDALSTRVIYGVHFVCHSQPWDWPEEESE